MKVTFAKLAVGLFSLMFLVTAARCFFFPEGVLELFSIGYEGSAGLSTIRGDLGGLFFAMCVFLLLGLRAHERYWITATNLIILFIVLGRVIGMVLDEFTQHLLTITAIEIVIVLAIAAAQFVLKQDDSRAASSNSPS